MKKSFIYIFLIFSFLFLFNILSVNAKNYSCSYYSENGWWKLYLDYEVKDNKITFNWDSEFGMTYHVVSYMDYKFDSKYNGKSEEEQNSILVKFLDGKCQKQVYICEGLDSEYENSSYAVLFDGQYHEQAVKYEGTTRIYDKDEGNVSVIFKGGKNNCFLISVQEDSSSGEIIDSLGNSCKKYDVYYSYLKMYYDECHNENNINSCNQYNHYKDNIKTYCSSLFKFTDYLNPCLKNCNNLQSDISEIEGSSSESRTCNMSNRIIKFIANILKWVKYVAPVLVIILGILDFIKAMAAQNDDQMKKAQGKFVKRLIAAALLFIVPFIIEFVLDKFNLVSDDPFCKII